jgi:hypothetical protein
VNIDAAGQLAFIVHDALGGDHLSATKTYRIEDVVYELMRKFNVEISPRRTLVPCEGLKHKLRIHDAHPNYREIYPLPPRTRVPTRSTSQTQFDVL